VNSAVTLIDGDAAWNGVAVRVGDRRICSYCRREWWAESSSSIFGSVQIGLAIGESVILEIDPCLARAGNRSSRTKLWINFDPRSVDRIGRDIRNSSGSPSRAAIGAFVQTSL